MARCLFLLMGCKVSLMMSNICLVVVCVTLTLNAPYHSHSYYDLSLQDDFILFFRLNTSE